MRHFKMTRYERIELESKNINQTHCLVMKGIFLLLVLLIATTTQAQQKVIQLYNGAAPGSENWDWKEKSSGGNGDIVYNVSHPTLTVFSANPSKANGTAIVICPGGGFHILAVSHEGTQVAQWLAEKGITAFVLRYRLAHVLSDDPVKEMTEKQKNGTFDRDVDADIPFSVADGREAIKYVRAHAAEYQIDKNKIGIIGFSAGGTVTASAAFNYNADNRPDFAAPIYPYMPDSLQSKVAADAPPLFLTVATDDRLGFAQHAISLYNKWYAAKRPVEMHLYAKGGHGFGMHKQNIPTDTWIERFYEWLGVEGFLKK